MKLTELFEADKNGIEYFKSRSAFINCGKKHKMTLKVKGDWKPSLYAYSAEGDVMGIFDEEKKTGWIKTSPGETK